MTQVTAEMQEIIDRFGWAEEWTDIVAATMDLTRHVDARLTALEAKPQAPVSLSVILAERDQAEEQYSELWKSYSELKRVADARTAQLDDLRNVNAGLRQVNTALRNDNARMTAELAALR